MDKEKNRSQAVQIKERSGRSPYFCRKAERAAPVLVGSILLYLNMERPSPFLKFSFAQSYSTLLPGLRAVKQTGAWQHPAGLSPPEDLSSCPHCLRLWLDRLLLPGRRDHCETGRHACFWLDDDRYAPFLPFIDIGVIPMQVVFAHPPNRCSPSSGERLPLLFVTGYDRLSGVFQGSDEKLSLASV